MQSFVVHGSYRLQLLSFVPNTVAKLKILLLHTENEGSAVCLVPHHSQSEAGILSSSDNIICLNHKAILFLISSHFLCIRISNLLPKGKRDLADLRQNV